MIKTPPLLAVLLLPSLAAAASPPKETLDPDWLRRQTVLIEVKEAGKDEEEIGSGVLLCQVANQAYVLTANHVLFGHDPLGRPRTLLDVERIKISFYQGEAGAVVEEPQSENNSDVITKTPVKGKDLLLLSFAVPELLKARPSLGEAPTTGEIEAGKNRGGLSVHAVGANRVAESWVTLDGRLSQRNDSFLVHDVPVEEGFSGGPLFNGAGALIGLTVQTLGEEGHRTGGYALPIDEVQKAIDKFVPAACFRSFDKEANEEKAAQDAYRKAMRQVSLQDWSKAKESLDEALKHKNLEGGSVHLQGMRYTEYLPYFHLGLVYYHQKECGKALNALAISDNQGVIQGNKRYRTLRKLLKKCGEPEAPAS